MGRLAAAMADPAGATVTPAQLIPRRRTERHVFTEEDSARARARCGMGPGCYVCAMLVPHVETARWWEWLGRRFRYHAKWGRP